MKQMIMRMKDVIRVTSLGRSTIYRLRSAGAFPSPLNLTDYAVGWRQEDIENWISEQTADLTG